MSQADDKTMIRRVGNRWVFPDGRTLPVISGGDGPVEDPADEPTDPVEPEPIEVPEDLTTVEDLDALRAELLDSFDAEVAKDDSDLEYLEEVAAAVDRIDAEKTRRDEEAAKVQEKKDQLKARVRPDADDEPEADEPDEPEAVADEPDPEPEVVAEQEPEPVAASAKPAKPLGIRRASAAGIAANSAKPNVPAKRDNDVVSSIVAAAGVPGHSIGENLSLVDLAQGFMDVARGLPNGGKQHVATVDIPTRYSIPEGASVETVQSILASACDPNRLLTNGSLTAAGGWCAPPETVWQFFALESTDGLISLPTVNMGRGSLQVPDFLGFADTNGSLWTWTETQDINAVQSGQIVNKALTTNVATLTTQSAHGITSGDQVKVEGVGAPFDGTFTTTAVTSTTFSYAVTAGNVSSAAVSPPGRWTDLTGEQTKPCLKIPCPGFTEYTLEAEGMCVTHGNLSSRAWPELQTRFVSLVVAAHLHRISAAIVSKLQADMVDVTVPDSTSDTYGNLLNAVAIQAEDIRSQYRMAKNAPVEVAFPMWINAPMKTSFAMRNGVDLTRVTDADIAAGFNNIGVRPQYVYALDPLWSSGQSTAWHTTSKFLIWPAGSYFEGTGGTLDLGVTRDSTLNATNDFTAAWSETFYTVGRYGPAGREVTFTVAADGVTGGP